MGINTFMIKYASLGFAHSVIPSEAFSIIEDYNLVTSRKRILVDYKEQQLKSGNTTCLSGWHRDTIADKNAIHHLFVIGAPTEFKICGEVFSIKEREWFKYTSEFHRGPKVDKDCKRTLIRLTETDLIMPVNKIYR